MVCVSFMARDVKLLVLACLSACDLFPGRGAMDVWVKQELRKLKIQDSFFSSSKSSICLLLYSTHPPLRVDSILLASHTLAQNT